VGSGLLIQNADVREVAADELRVVTKRAPSDAQLADLLFAWRVAKYVKSNAIVFCGDGATLGVGAGQMSRIDSARIASIKAATRASRWRLVVARTPSSRSATGSTWSSTPARSR
jgi:phosphoribosylaminoimidazolecarboxamide formyltransferase/IMP cyclohydrolase